MDRQTIGTKQEGSGRGRKEESPTADFLWYFKEQGTHTHVLCTHVPTTRAASPSRRPLGPYPTKTQRFQKRVPATCGGRGCPAAETVAASAPENGRGRSIPAQTSSYHVLPRTAFNELPMTVLRALIKFSGYTMYPGATLVKISGRLDGSTSKLRGPPLTLRLASIRLYPFLIS